MASTLGLIALLDRARNALKVATADLDRANEAWMATAEPGAFRVPPETGPVFEALLAAQISHHEAQVAYGEALINFHQQKAINSRELLADLTAS